MVVFPALSALISLACAAVIARDAFRRPRPDKIAWAIAFALFAIAAGAEVFGSLQEWTPLLARAYYLAGAVLVVGFLALGELYLLAGGKINRLAPGAALLVTVVAATMVWNAPVDSSKLAVDGWEAVERGPALVALAATINGVGTLILIAGLGYSAWRFRRRGIQRNRMIGCTLIAIGTLVVAMGGTLTRFGQPEYLYIAMSLGVAVIFTGVLWTRRTDAAPVSATLGSPGPGTSSARGSLIALPVARARPERVPIADPAIAFIEGRLLPLDAVALAAECRIWSIESDDAPTFSRDEARRVWSLRVRLSPEAQRRFDILSVPLRRQLADLYTDVLTSDQSTAYGRQS